MWLTWLSTVLPLNFPLFIFARMLSAAAFSPSVRRRNIASGCSPFAFALALITRR